MCHSDRVPSHKCDPALTNFTFLRHPDGKHGSRRCGGIFDAGSSGKGSMAEIRGVTTRIGGREGDMIVDSSNDSAIGNVRVAGKISVVKVDAQARAL